MEARELLASNPVVVVTAMPLSVRARADLSAMLGDAYVVLDIKVAPSSANIVLTPVVSPHLMGGLRGLFPDARIVFTELCDDGYGIELAGPLARVAAAGPDGYFVAGALAGVAPIVQAEARLQLSGSTQRTPPRIGPAPDESFFVPADPVERRRPGTVVWVRDTAVGARPSRGRWLDLAVFDAVVVGLLSTSQPRESLLWAALVAETAEHLAHERDETVLVDVSGLVPEIRAELQIRVASSFVDTSWWPPSHEPASTVESSANSTPA